MKIINIDNINLLLGDDLKQNIKSNAKLKIVSSNFSIFTYEALKKQLSKIKNLEFILTRPLFLSENFTNNKQQKEFIISKNDEKNFCGSEFEIELKNKLTQKAIAKECARWIEQKVTFKTNLTGNLMQQYMCIENEQNHSIYNPLQGFSMAELGYQKGNSISNFILKIENSDITKTYLKLFDELWNDKTKLKDITQELMANLSLAYKENSPQSIYYMILYNIFNEFLENENDELINDKTGIKTTIIWNKLYNFQKDAVRGIINRLESFNGCILADSVGLGKTFSALAVIKYYELRNKSVLVLCPKKLSENWRNYNTNTKTNILFKDRFNYDVLHHSDIQRNSGISNAISLDKINWGNYDLVVIDESHNFRNNVAYKEKETRYQKLMNKIIKTGVKTKVLMLSATPVNNKFNDLKNQLALAYEGDSLKFTEKLQISKSIEEIFKKAQLEFNAWSKLPLKQRNATTILNMLEFDFFKVLDSVTIARSRKHIQTFYDTLEIGTFPKRLKPLAFHPKLTQKENAPNFNEIYEQLILLKLSIYTPTTYILSSCLSKYEEIYDTLIKNGKTKFRQMDREKSLRSLMVTNLLKRLESSVYSFNLTLERLKQKNKDIIDKISNFNDKSKIFYDISLDDEDEDINIGEKVKINLKDIDNISFKRDLEYDLFLISNLQEKIMQITPEYDFKLQHLKEHVKQKINNPININNKKIIIFTAFADTANYIYENLSKVFVEKYNLNLALITGSLPPKSTLKKNYDFQSLLTLFSPISKEKDKTLPNELNQIDILIATDCISEGQNLQDCDYMINYDIHWNPVRIIQRFGRIDRIGSKNLCIQMVNYWPDITLDEYINLKQRVENRMIIADVSASGDENVLELNANDLAYRKEQLKKLQSEVIEMEDLKTGVNIVDLGLNDFRMDLLKYLENNKFVSKLPNGIHTVIPSQKNLSPGVIFVLLNRNKNINIDQQNRLHPYYLVYISNENEILLNHTEPKKILDLIKLTCKNNAAPIKKAYEKFNQITNDAKDMKKYSKLLEDAVASIVQVKEDKDIDSLFSSRQTLALNLEIKGLKDFELISFIVVQDI